MTIQTIPRSGDGEVVTAASGKIVSEQQQAMRCGDEGA
jgi:hypothetical protein